MDRCNQAQTAAAEGCRGFVRQGRAARPVPGKKVLYLQPLFSPYPLRRRLAVLDYPIIQLFDVLFNHLS